MKFVNEPDIYVRAAIITFIVQLIITFIIIKIVYDNCIDTVNTNIKHVKNILIWVFIVTVFVFDILNAWIPMFFTDFGFTESQIHSRVDIFTDIIVLGLFTFIIIPKVDPEHYKFIKFLWWFRLIGTILFEVSGDENYLVYFGNYVEFAILVSLLPIELTNSEYYEIITVSFGFKFLQEIFKHSSQFKTSGSLSLNRKLAKAFGFKKGLE